MNDEQRRAVLPELDRLTREAQDLMNDIDELLAGHGLIKDPTLAPCNVAGHKLRNELRNAAETLRRESASDVQNYVTGWYRALHYDMSDPIVEVDEKDLTDPLYESCTYDGQDSFHDWYKWTVVMQTVTHGREKVIVFGDGVDFTIYSAEKMS